MHSSDGAKTAMKSGNVLWAVLYLVSVEIATTNKNQASVSLLIKIFQFRETKILTFISVLVPELRIGLLYLIYKNPDNH